MTNIVFAICTVVTASILRLSNWVRKNYLSGKKSETERGRRMANIPQLPRIQRTTSTSATFIIPHWKNRSY